MKWNQSPNTSSKISGISSHIATMLGCSRVELQMTSQNGKTFYGTIQILMSIYRLIGLALLLHGPLGFLAW